MNTELEQALNGIGVTGGYPGTREMVAALDKAVEGFHSREAVEINARADVSRFREKFSSGEMSLLDKDAEAKLLTQAREKRAGDALAGIVAAREAHRAISAQVEANIARQRELPSTEAALANKGDINTGLLARLVDGQEAEAAARFVTSRPAADVLARYRNADESQDRSFVRYVEAAHAGQYLTLADAGDPVQTVNTTRALGEAIHMRREARIGAAEREARELLPKLAADVARAELEMAPSDQAILRALKMAGQPGTKARG